MGVAFFFNMLPRVADIFLDVAQLLPKFSSEVRSAENNATEKRKESGSKSKKFILLQKKKYTHMRPAWEATWNYCKQSLQRAVPRAFAGISHSFWDTDKI